MAHQAALVGVIERITAKREFLCFADIMQQRPGDEQGTVNCGIKPGHGVGQAGYGQGMLQQSAIIGMMHSFCRRRLLKSGKKILVSKDGQQQIVQIGLIGK